MPQGPELRRTGLWVSASEWLRALLAHLKLEKEVQERSRGCPAPSRAWGGAQSEAQSPRLPTSGDESGKGWSVPSPVQMPPRLPANLVVSSRSSSLSRPSLAAWPPPSFPRPDVSSLSSPSSLFPVKLLGEWGVARAAETTSLKRQVQWQCP